MRGINFWRISNGNSTTKSYLHNKRIANLILLGSTLCIGLILYLEYTIGKSFGLSMLGYIIEAILIASVADSIAIYALDHRIQIPILGKFTGLIQNKRRELIDGIIVACKTKFFPKEKLVKLICRISITTYLKDLLEKGIISSKNRESGKFLSMIMTKNKDSIAEGTMQALEKYILSIKADKAIVSIHDMAKSNGWLNKLVSDLFENLYATVKEYEFRDNLDTAIRTAIYEKKNSGNIFTNTFNKAAYGFLEITDTLNYSELASSIQSAIVEILENIIEEGNRRGNRWSVLESEISKLILKLSQNKKFIKEIDNWKAELVQRSNLKQYTISAIEKMAEWIEDGIITWEEINRVLKNLGFEMKGISPKDINISEWISKIVLIGLDRLIQSGKNVQIEFEKLFEKLIENEYEDCLNIVKEIIETLSDKGLAKKINDVAGGNLQWLRISGALVGGITGIFIFLILAFPVPGFVLLFILALAIIFSKNLRAKLVRYKNEDYLTQTIMKEEAIQQ